MLPVHVMPVLLAILVASLLCLVGWGLVRERMTRQEVRLMDSRDDLLISLLVLAAIALGVFLTYLVSVVGV